MATISTTFAVPTMPRRRRTRIQFPARRFIIRSALERDACGWDYGGGLVDENMIVLRKRIHETKMVERNYEPPSDWEKRYYTTYDSDVCEAVEFLQAILMSSRPSVAIGTLALLAISVPMSGAFILLHLVDILRHRKAT